MASPLNVNLNKSQKYFNKAINFVADKTKVAVAHFQDELQKSMVKAMNHDNTPPKEKHVRRILAASGGKREMSTKDLVAKLGEMVMNSKDWLVRILFFYLILFRYLLRDFKFFTDVFKKATKTLLRQF
jgi:hypothetical protein